MNQGALCRWIQEILEVRLQHPFDFAARDLLVKSRQRLMGASAGPAAERAWKKILLVDGRQHLRGTSLKRPVRYSGYAQRAHLLLSRLRNIDSPNIRRSISLSVYGLQHARNPFLKALFRLRYPLSIHSRSGFGWNLTETLPNPLLGDVMSQRGEAEFRLAPSFVCYSFESCCHDWLFFSWHRRPNPPFEWSSCFPRTIQLPLPASPCSRLSRPRSTIRQSDLRQAFRSSLPHQLVGPYKLGLSLTDLPCSHEILWLHASGTNPGSNSAHLPYRMLSFCLPLRGIRSAASITIDFGAIFPFTVILACKPSGLRFAMAVTGHHARLGTRLRARLCRGLHFRRLDSTSFQGTTLRRSGQALLTHPAPTLGDNV